MNFAYGSKPIFSFKFVTSFQGPFQIASLIYCPIVSRVSIISCPTRISVFLLDTSSQGTFHVLSCNRFKEEPEAQLISNFLSLEPFTQRKVSLAFNLIPGMASRKSRRTYEGKLYNFDRRKRIGSWELRIIYLLESDRKSVV